MNILLVLFILFLFFFIMNNKEGFVQNYNYPIPLDPTNNEIFTQMKNPKVGTINTDDVVRADLNLFNNASNILYGMQRIPLPNLPIKQYP